MVSLPPPLNEYFDAANARDVKVFIACFMPDASVHDEGHVYQGHDEVRAWFLKTGEAYNVTYVVKHCAMFDGGAEVTATVSGTFPGSPLDLKTRFSLRDDKITKLEAGL